MAQLAAPARRLSQLTVPALPSQCSMTRAQRPVVSVRAAGRIPARRLSVAVRAGPHWDASRAPGVAPAPAAAIPSSVAVPGGTVLHFDFLVIGSGIAGLSYALKVAEYGTVAIVTKDFANEGCTQYAQGGVCAVLDRTDSVEQHVHDTMVAGGYLNDPSAVDVVCREGPARVMELVAMGAEFTRNQDGSLHLTKEGGHSARRIVHAADLTGREIERALLAAARAHKNIRFFEHHLAVDLVVEDHQGMPHCFGIDVLDQHAMAMSRFVALSTMLASGGAGQVYPSTTNPHVATGDGIAMAFRASATISNMEFVQFHPTALYEPANTGRTFLITEAVRGEGGMLFNKAGERFMQKYDSVRMELAPRDVVAQSIHNELLQREEPHVLLDISHKPAQEVLHHFPNIAAKCAQLGLDITRDPIPVLPAQHYTCGGVQTGLLGETSVQGLYACGEVACSGLHGANRLASNSLLEGLVFADRAAGPSVAHAEHALRSCGPQLHYVAASADFSGARGPKPLSPSLLAWAAAQRAELRTTMWRCAGIVRRTADLQVALDHALGLCVEAKALLASYGYSTPLVELLNLATVAEITVACALQRKESRGGHYCLDYPHQVEAERRPSLVARGSAARSRRTVRTLQPLSPAAAGVSMMGASLGPGVGSGLSKLAVGGARAVAAGTRGKAGGEGAGAVGVGGEARPPGSKPGVEPGLTAAGAATGAINGQTGKKLGSGSPAKRRQLAPQRDLAVRSMQEE
ncbi:L-aspartate oxidase [Haematococcus lacustris]